MAATLKYSEYMINGRIPVEIPADFPWQPNFSLAISNNENGAVQGYCSKTPVEIFNEYSTAYSAPGTELYVHPTSGNDTTGTGTSGNPFQTIGKAIDIANAAGLPAKIHLRQQTSTTDYSRTKNFSAGGAKYPTVDVAYVFYGRTIVSTHDDFNAPSLDATYTNCYFVAQTNAVENVVYRDQVTAYNTPLQMKYMPTAALCNATPGSWANTTGGVLINRGDGSAVTRDNTRVFMTSIRNLRQNLVDVSLGFFPATPDASLTVYGAATNNSPIDILMANTVTSLTPRCVVMQNVRSIPFGNKSSSSGSARAFSIDGVNGVVALFNCFGADTGTDAFNFHNTRGAVVPGVQTKVLTVNCSSMSCGIPGQNSNNGFTTHEDVIAIDVGGDYQLASGGAMRNINTTQTLCAGTMVQDRGDLYLNPGSQLVYPTGFMTGDTAKMWCFRTRTGQRQGEYDYYAGAGCKIFLREVWPGVGTRAGDVTEY